MEIPRRWGYGVLSLTLERGLPTGSQIDTVVQAEQTGVLPNILTPQEVLTLGPDFWEKNRRLGGRHQWSGLYPRPDNQTSKKLHEILDQSVVPPIYRGSERKFMLVQAHYRVNPLAPWSRRTHRTPYAEAQKSDTDLVVDPVTFDVIKDEFHIPERKTRLLNGLWDVSYVDEDGFTYHVSTIKNRNEPIDGTVYAASTDFKDRDKGVYYSRNDTANVVYHGNEKLVTFDPINVILPPTEVIRARYSLAPREFGEAFLIQQGLIAIFTSPELAIKELAFSYYDDCKSEVMNTIGRQINEISDYELTTEEANSITERFIKEWNIGFSIWNQDIYNIQAYLYSFLHFTNLLPRLYEAFEKTKFSDSDKEEERRFLQSYIGHNVDYCYSPVRNYREATDMITDPELWHNRYAEKLR